MDTGGRENVDKGGGEDVDNGGGRMWIMVGAGRCGCRREGENMDKDGGEDMHNGGEEDVDTGGGGDVHVDVDKGERGRKMGRR